MVVTTELQQYDNEQYGRMGNFIVFKDFWRFREKYKVFVWWVRAKPDCQKFVKNGECGGQARAWKLRNTIKLFATKLLAIKFLRFCCHEFWRRLVGEFITSNNQFLNMLYTFYEYICIDCLRIYSWKVTKNLILMLMNLLLKLKLLIP